MPTFVALLRGINVGGKNPLPMKSLAAILEQLKCRNVRTYIQSGNVVFEQRNISTSKFGRKIGSAIKAQHGFEPSVQVLAAKALQKVVAANPFPHAEADAKYLHVFFLEQVPPGPDLDAMQQYKKESESFALVEQAFYLYAPDGIARSKVAAKVEKLFGVGATARNWRTVSKLLELSQLS